MRTIKSRRKQASVDGFVGRQSEQQRFRTTLRQLTALRDTSDDDIEDEYAQIFLVLAEGGMGKSTLLRRFEAIVQEEGHARAILIDLEEHKPIGDDWDKLLRVLHDALCRAGLEREMQPFRDALKRRDEVQHKAADAEERYKSMADFGGRAVQLASGGLLDHELVAEGIHAGAVGLAGLRNYVRRALSDDDWRLYEDPPTIADDFMQALNRIATPKRPLVVLLDTYELADACDTWMRERVLPSTGMRLVWVIAGREGNAFVQRYKDALGAGVIDGILLDTFVRADIEAYLQQHNIDADAALIDQLEALSRGVPIALKGWVELYRQREPLPEADRDRPTDRRAIVYDVTRRFLRYCEDDIGLIPAERRDRDATRIAILSLMLLCTTDMDALAAMWQVTAQQAEERLNRLSDRFSFVFADSIERQPHALVKQFVREHLRDLPQYPVALREGIERLVEHYEGNLHARERVLWGLGEAPPSLSDEQIAALRRQRDEHRRRRDQLDLQIATYGIAAPPYIQRDREEADAAIAAIDVQLATQNTPVLPEEAPRRVLWEDADWRRILLNLINALCWQDQFGEHALQLGLPMLIEAWAFHKDSTTPIEALLNEFRGSWQSLLIRGIDEGQALMDMTERLHLTSLHKAAVLIRIGQEYLADTARTYERRCADALENADRAAALLPEDGGELGKVLARLYRNIGSKYILPGKEPGKANPKAGLSPLNMAARLHSADAYAWYYLGVAFTQQRLYEEAIAAYQQAIEKAPTLAWPYNGLGNVYRSQKRYEEAISMVQRVIEKDPNFAGAYNNLGLLYRDQKRYEEAVAAYQQAIERDPASASGAYGKTVTDAAFVRRSGSRIVTCGASPDAVTSRRLPRSLTRSSWVGE